MKTKLLLVLFILNANYLVAQVNNGIKNTYDVIDKRLRLQTLAEKGDKDALNLLGLSYLEDVPKDKEKAFKLFQQASKAGSVPAEFNVAFCYYYGEGTIANYSEAYRLFKEQYLKKEKKASYYLGSMFLYGQGVEKDYKKAIEYLTEAKGNGMGIADVILGYCYAKGLGVEKNVSYGLSLLVPSANKNDILAQLYVADIYNEQGKTDEALYWYEKISDKHSLASVIIGDIYVSENNIAKAKQYYRQASDYGVTMGEWKLGEILYNEAKKLDDNGFSSDADKRYNEAFQLLKEASEDRETPVPSAMRLLQACYRYGRGTKIDEQMADIWIKEAEKHKDVKTLELLEMEINRKKY